MARTTPVNTGYTIINGTATGSNGYRVDVWLEYKVLSQSILNNTSELHLLLYAAATYSSTTKWETPGNYGYVGYDGSNKQYYNTAYDFSGYQVNKFGDYTYTIAHNSNGQKSITAQGAFTTLSSYISGGSASGTVVLPTIARATTLTAQSATLGTEKTFTLSPADASFKHSMSFTFGSASGSITGVTASTSIAYTFSIDLAAQVPNATSGAGTLTISTYASDGTTLIGTSTATVMLSVPASVVPTGTVDIEEGVPGIAAQFGAFVRSKSKLSVSIDASGAYGSTIVGYSTTIESTVYSGATFASGFLAQSGSKTAVTIITDSRGRTATINTNYTVVAYENPAIETFTAERCNSGGTPDDEGAHVKVALKGSVSSANNGNTASYKVLYKKTTDESYSEYAFSEAGYAIDDNDIISGISPDYTWDFVAQITDYFTNTQRPLTISTAATIMDIKSNGLGVSFGKVAENDGLEVGWPATFNDTITHISGAGMDAGGNMNLPTGAAYKIDGTALSKSDVGLGNVTDNAQVKKIASSTNGAIVTWSGTGGDTQSDSGVPLSRVMYHYTTEIPTNANFNDYTTTGIYTIASNTNHVNGPGFAWGILVVFRTRSGYVQQIAYRMGYTTIKQRNYNQTSWTAWA